MLKWTLNRGRQENSVTAEGTDYRSGYHKTFTITGTTGPLEGGKMRVDLKIWYSATWFNINMTGYFDPEENALRGTTEMSDGTPGEFVFKRDPDLVHLCPAPSRITARARWEFAATVILGRIRRQSWSPSYILKRIKDGRRYMELVVRHDHYGRLLDDDESDEYRSLLSLLYETDARFYASLIDIKLSKVLIQYVGGYLHGFWLALTLRECSPVDCDFCGAENLGGARVLCMDCHSGETTLDLCAEPECLNSVITLEDRPDLETPHTPSHSVLKFHRILFKRDTARAERDAKAALEVARETISDLKAKKKPMPQCVHCQRVVPLPCWYCADCTGEVPENHHFHPLLIRILFAEETFICADCEYECLAFTETHTKNHMLVRVIRKAGKSKVSMRKKMKAVEGQLVSVQDELSKIRQLLTKLFEKGTEGSPSDPLTKGDILDAATAEPGLAGPLLSRCGGGEGGENQESSGGEDIDQEGSGEEYEDQEGSDDEFEDQESFSDEDGDGSGSEEDEELND